MKITEVSRDQHGNVELKCEGGACEKAAVRVQCTKEFVEIRSPIKRGGRSCPAALTPDALRQIADTADELINEACVVKLSLELEGDVDVHLDEDGDIRVDVGVRDSVLLSPRDVEPFIAAIRKVVK